MASDTGPDQRRPCNVARHKLLERRKAICPNPPTALPFEPLRHLTFIGMGCGHFAADRLERAAVWARSGLEANSAARIVVAAGVHADAGAEARRTARWLLRKDPDLTMWEVERIGLFHQRSIRERFRSLARGRPPSLGRRSSLLSGVQPKRQDASCGALQQPNLRCATFSLAATYCARRQ